MVSSITVGTVSLQGFHLALPEPEEKSMALHSAAPPFTPDSAIKKIRIAEDNWNSRNPEKVALAYTLDSRWRNRAEFVNGRQEIVAPYTQMDTGARLPPNQRALAFTYDRIAVRFA
jgi:nuclear transport factor 2 (NTF2) superfamily protein